MSAMLRKFNFLSTSQPRVANSSRRKSKAQSMVEFAILLPLLIMLFSGMVEFGFMMNTYLSLLDATRSAAREYSNKTPFLLDPLTNTVIDDPNFYSDAAKLVKDTLAPPEDPNARRLVLDPSRDDVLVSVLSVGVNSITNTMAITRHPDGALFYSYYGNQDSAYRQDTDIENLMTQNGTTPVQTGMLIVEVYYGYSGLLHLPWVEAFMSADNPVMLHASTIMPLVTAKPLSTPTP